MMNIEELKKQIKPCDPEKPFAFISYSKKDSERVYPLVLSLQKEGCNLWIDKELEKAVGEDWQKALKVMESRKCKAIVFMMSSNSLISAPVLAELTWSQRSPKVLRHNENEPLKFLPVNVDEKWRIKNNGALRDWIKSEVNQVSDKITGADMDALAPVRGGECLPEKYYSGAYSLEEGEVGEIADACYNEILTPLGGNRLTLVEYTDVNVIMDNILNKTGCQSLQSEVQTDVPDTKINDTEEKCESESGKLSSEPAPTAGTAPEKVKTRPSTLTGIITYTIYGKEYRDNQADMMLNVFAKVLQKHPEAVDTILADPEKPLIRCASLINYELPENRTENMPSRYNSGCFLKIGRGIFIGTALNYKEKLRNISQLLSICNEDFSILQSDQIELPNDVKTKSSSGGDESFCINGEQRTGNQTEMMCEILKFLIEKHFDKKDELAELLSIKIAPISELSNLSYFRTGREYSYQGVIYSVGTSFSKNDKLKQIKKAADICGESLDQFGNDSLSDLGISEPSRTSSRTISKKRDFLND